MLDTVCRHSGRGRASPAMRNPGNPFDALDSSPDLLKSNPKTGQIAKLRWAPRIANRERANHVRQTQMPSGRIQGPSRHRGREGPEDHHRARPRVQDPLLSAFIYSLRLSIES